MVGGGRREEGCTQAPQRHDSREQKKKKNPQSGDPGSAHEGLIAEAKKPEKQRWGLGLGEGGGVSSTPPV